MKDIFKAIKVTDNVYWVGAIDWAVRDFHGYLTSRGTTYNAYLIMADKITLVDTVKAAFTNEMLARIASVLGDRKLSYIISNHAEPDHSGALGAAIELFKPEKVFAAAAGVKALEQHFHSNWQITPVKDMETIALGNMDVTCMDARMCHWPESMITYLRQARLLFSQDAFGMHLAGSERFDDEVNPVRLDEEAAKYFANILLPFTNFINKLLDKVSAAGWKIDIIAPDHGPIWRQRPLHPIECYRRWAKQPRVNRAVIVYDTMWGSTDLMARAVAEGLWAGGTPAKLMPMGGSHRSDIATELLDAGALLVGAPTINNEMFPTLADVLSYLKGLGPRGLVGASFGSFGWSGQAAKDLKTILEEMQVEVVSEPVRAMYNPSGEELKKCYDLGLAVAARLKAKA